MRYTSAGPMPALADPSAAQSESRALQDIGNVLSNIGERGLRLSQQVRRAEEAQVESDLFTQLDEQAAQFANQLLTRQDTDNWIPEWRQFMGDVERQAKERNLSPEAWARMQTRLREWGSTRSIRFEGMAAVKKIEGTKVGLDSGLEYAMGRNDREGVARNLQLRRESGIYAPEEIEHFERVAEQGLAAAELELRTLEDPRAIAEAAKDPGFLNLPGNEHLADTDRKRALRLAEGRIQEIRGEEMETLETAMMQGRLTPADIEAAEYLTPKDKLNFHHALGRNDPPSNEDHARAWQALDDLRDARNDPGMDNERYRALYNEARGAVLRRIPSQWQGDIKQELSYLTPAGRQDPTDPSKVVIKAGDRRDLLSAARAAVARARSAGAFGPVDDHIPHAQREKAYRKELDIQNKVRIFSAANPQATLAELMNYTDQLIGQSIDGDAPLIPAAPPAFRFDGELDGFLLPPKPTE